MTVGQTRQGIVECQMLNVVVGFVQVGTHPFERIRDTPQLIVGFRL
ncbi:MAG: hypothetical protein ACI8W7_003923 [Gammaproteobacteria bacterium]|jgi:hypothetical protein